MAKIRVYELARELGLESKDVLARVHELGIEAKTASSGLEPVDAGTVRQSYASAEEVQPVPEPEVLGKHLLEGIERRLTSPTGAGAADALTHP